MCGAVLLYLGVSLTYGINFEVNGLRRRTASETRENDQDTITLRVGSNQHVHYFQARVVRLTFHVPADSNQSNVFTGIQSGKKLIGLQSKHNNNNKKKMMTTNTHECKAISQWN